jgi:membrane protease YdiL (CAAX protease family)
MFIENAYSGKNQVWRYISTVVVVYIAAAVIGVIPLFIVTLIGIAKSSTFAIPENAADFAAIGINQNLGLLVMLVPFAVGLLFLVLSVRKIHKRPALSMLTSRKSFSQDRFFYGAAIWAVFMIVSLAIHIIAEPANYLFQPDWKSFLPLIPITLIFIPLQAGFEEAFFRGYLMQAFGLLFRYRWIAILITGLGFGLLHSYNPEVKAYGFWLTMPEYAGLGLFFGLITLLDGGLELAAGIHIINNIFLSLFITNENSSLQTSALIHVQKINPFTDFVEIYIFMILFIFLAWRHFKWQDWKLNIFGRILPPPIKMDVNINTPGNLSN